MSCEITFLVYEILKHTCNHSEYLELKYLIKHNLNAKPFQNVKEVYCNPIHHIPPAILRIHKREFLFFVALIP